MPDVGVVMPVYIQKAAYLSAALESLLNQQYPHFRTVIVVDGAPHMLPVIRETVQDDSRFVIIVLPENRGVAHALNRGFEELLKDSDIKYLTWVSSDNIYHPNFLLALRHGLQTSPPQVGVVYSCFQDIDDVGRPLLDANGLERRRRYQQRPKEALLDFHFIGVSFMYKADDARRIGGYRLEPVEDYDYFLRLTEHCDVRYIPDVLMNYRVHSPYSVSAQLRHSVEQHRRWRFMYQWAKHEARLRRGIPPELTVLFPVQAMDASVTLSYENVLDQYFSNFHLYVLDATPGRQATETLQKIPDPRVGFVPVDGSLPTSMYTVTQQTTTPFLFFWSQGPLLLDSQFLQVLMENFKKPDHLHHLAVSFPNCRLGPLIQFRDEPAPEEPVFFHLYRTAKLRHVWARPMSYPNPFTIGRMV